MSAIYQQLTIDSSRCYGLENCYVCEIIMPGLVKYCENYKVLNLKDWAMQANKDKISKVLIACEPKAIMLVPIYFKG